MTKYLAGVLSVIAVGILMIAYGLLKPVTPTVAAFEARGALQQQLAQPAVVGERIMLSDDPYAPRYVAAAPAPYGAYAPAPAYPAAYPVNYPVYQPAPGVAQPVRTVTTAAAPQRVVTRTVERTPKRDWKKTALVIGGSTAGGAGLGAVFGGKKGALIGAAIGGGASTIYEATKR
jgi:hypothetical protein